MLHSFSSEQELKKYIKDCTSEIFGEDITWFRTNLPGENGQIQPDLIGRDVNNKPVIVEVKPFHPRRGANQYYKPREAVGQVLHYATAYIQKRLTDPRDLSNEQLTDELKNVRLFILGDVYSEPVEKMCHLLQAHGINIVYISLDCI